MNQRGSVGVYLLLSIAAAVASGYGVYSYLHTHKAPAPLPEAAPVPVVVSPTAPPPVAAPPEAPVVAETSLAEQRAIDPVIDENHLSPFMGVPGIDGPVERGSIDRRMRVKARALQTCWERDGVAPVTIHVTLHVDVGGRVTSTTLSPGLSPGTEACIATVLGSLSFSSFASPTEIVQPISFR